MALPLPAFAFAVEGNLPVQLHPGHILSQELLPGIVPFTGRPAGILIDQVLEMVHHRSVGNKGQRRGQVAVQELPGVGPEEVLRPRPGHELHGHGVDFTGFHAGPHIAHGNPVPVHVSRERVSGLMGHHFHVALGSVEVGKDEGHTVIHQAGAVAAAFLTLGGKHVHQLSFQHHVEELAGLRGKLIIELFAGGQDIVGRSFGPGIAGAEFQRVVRKAHGVFLAQALRLLPVDAVRHRHQVGPYRLPELLHIFLGIAVPAHAVVTQGGVAFIAQLLSHGIPQACQLVIDFIQLVLVFLVPLSFGFPGGQALCVIRAGFERSQLGQGIHAALKGNLSGSDQLLVFVAQVIFLLQLGNDLRGEGLQFNLRVDEHQAAVLRFKILAEGRSQHRRGPGLVILLQFRPGLVPEINLPVIERIPGINGMADVGQVDQRVHMAHFLLLLQENFLCFLIVLRTLQAFRQGF